MNNLFLQEHDDQRYRDIKPLFFLKKTFLTLRGSLKKRSI